LSGEARETIYGVLTHALSYVVLLIAVVVIAGIWGVDLSGVYATLTSATAQDYYRRLASAIIIIVISSLFLRSAYYLIDKIFDLSAEEVRAWRRRIALGDKGRTVAPLLKSLLKYGTIFVGGVLVLRAMGVDPTPIIAGAGVIGLAVGFGAQTLVKDVISGFFLLFEGVIAVGDAITFGNSGGVVEEVGLRVTKYRTFSGELWVIPNGEIRAFGNYNRQWTRAIVSVGVAYEQDVGKTMRIMEEVGKQWAEERRDIVLEAPEVQGIMSFDDSSVNLRLVIKVRPMQQWGAERQLRYRLKETFDREGVEIPFPRQVVYTRQEVNGVAERENGGPEENLSLLSTRIQKVEEAREQSGN
jgi:small-conductance mechanosensitive channel